MAERARYWITCYVCHDVPPTVYFQIPVDIVEAHLEEYKKNLSMRSLGMRELFEKHHDENQVRPFCQTCFIHSKKARETQAIPRVKRISYEEMDALRVVMEVMKT
jgi:hypothetical protein